MHDLTYANRIIDRLKKEVTKDAAANVTVEVSLSPFGHVTPERLKEVFGVIAEKEGFANVTLEVAALGFRIHCNNCGKIWESAEPTFQCPKCSSADFEVKRMEEFNIDAIRVG